MRLPVLTVAACVGALALTACQKKPEGSPMSPGQTGAASVDAAAESPPTNTGTAPDSTTPGNTPAGGAASGGTTPGAEPTTTIPASGAPASGTDAVSQPPH